MWLQFFSFAAWHHLLTSSLFIITSCSCQLVTIVPLASNWQSLQSSVLLGVIRQLCRPLHNHVPHSSLLYAKISPMPLFDPQTLVTAIISTLGRIFFFRIIRVHPIGFSLTRLFFINCRSVSQPRENFVRPSALFIGPVIMTIVSISQWPWHYLKGGTSIFRPFRLVFASLAIKPKRFYCRWMRASWYLWDYFSDDVCEVESKHKAVHLSGHDTCCHASATALLIMHYVGIILTVRPHNDEHKLGFASFYLQNSRPSAILWSMISDPN